VQKFSFCFGLSPLIGSSHVHKFLNLKFDGHTPYLYIVQNKMENKQYGINFEIVTSAQTILQLQNFPHAFCS
jgi:hypothetical protein